jgi:phosphatidylserine/phosphatidylglycerophosphate/cardiolipin synthase-like enzyme
MDDRWTCVGSDNVNLRSWTHDSELSLAVVDDDPATGFGRALRLRLHREHLEREDDGTDAGDLRDPAGAFAAYAAAAERLDQWHAAGRSGPRPPGRLRRYDPPALNSWSGVLARQVYRLIADPDGRPSSLRRAHAF